MQNLTKTFSQRLVRNEIPEYVTLLSKYLSTPIKINENKYVTEEDLKDNREKIYKWTQLPHINCRLSSYYDKETIFTKPKYFKNINKDC